MVGMNIFDSDAFSTFELTGALEKTDYKPQMLGGMGIFEVDRVRTQTVAVEKRDNVLALIPASERGAPLAQREDEKRDIRDFRTVRLAKGDALYAHEIQNIRAYGTNSELKQVQGEVNRKQARLLDDLELTWENHRLGALQGIVLDADGVSVIRNWYTEWGIAQPAEITFSFGATDFDLRTECHAITRLMMRAAKGAWNPSTEVHALCGDSFFDTLINDPSVTRTYENWEAAAALRGDLAFQTFGFGGIMWHNYRGTDDNSTVAVATDKAKFFPVGAPGVFKVAYSPGESFDWANQPGRDMYSVIVPDRDRNQKVEIEVYSYPLFMCTRPEMLQRATL